jgi:hypothetical protein
MWKKEEAKNKPAAVTWSFGLFRIWLSGLLSDYVLKNDAS